LMSALALNLLLLFRPSLMIAQQIV
jgi:hypothetical protein